MNADHRFRQRLCDFYANMLLFRNHSSGVSWERMKTFCFLIPEEKIVVVCEVLNIDVYDMLTPLFRSDTALWISVSNKLSS